MSKAKAIIASITIAAVIFVIAWNVNNIKVKEENVRIAKQELEIAQQEQDKAMNELRMTVDKLNALFSIPQVYAQTNETLVNTTLVNATEQLLPSFTYLPDPKSQEA